MAFHSDLDGKRERERKKLNDVILLFQSSRCSLMISIRSNSLSIISMRII